MSKAQSFPRAGRKALDKALSYWILGDFSNSKSYLEEELVDLSTLVPVMELKASCLAFRCKYGEAFALANEVLSRNPDSIFARSARVQSRFQISQERLTEEILRNQHEEDIGTLKSQISGLKKKDPIKMIMLCLTHILAKEWSDAEQVGNQFVHKEPKSAMWPLLCGMACRGMESEAKAMSHFSRSIGLIHNNSLCMLERAKIYKRMESLEHAIQDCRKVSEWDDMCVPVLYSRGKFCFAMGKYGEAEVDFTKFLHLNPSLRTKRRTLRALSSRAACMITKEKYAEAVRDYSDALQVSKENGEILYKRGEAQLLRNETTLAFEDFNAAISVKGQLSNEYVIKALQGLARAAEAVEDWESAKKKYEEALKLCESPQSTLYFDLMMSHASVCDSTGFLDDALKDYDIIFHLGRQENVEWIDDFDASKVLLSRAVLFRNNGKFKEAIEDLNRSISLRPSAHGYFERGVVNLVSSRTEGASSPVRGNVILEDLNRAIEMDGTNASFFYYRGMAQSEMGRIDDAKKDYEEAIRISPDHGGAHFFLALILRGMNDDENAMKEFDAAVEISPDNREYLFERGKMKCQKKLSGGYDPALVDFQECLLISEEEGYNDYEEHAYEFDADVHYWMGNAYFGMNAEESAEKEYGRALELNSRHLQALNNRAVLLKRNGRVRDSLADLDAAVQLSPGDSDLWNNRGNVHLLCRDITRAISDFSQAIRLNKEFVEAYNNRGIAYLKRHDISRALRDFETAKKLQKEDADIFCNAGTAHFCNGDRRKAIMNFEHAKELDENHQDAANNLQLLEKLRTSMSHS